MKHKVYITLVLLVLGLWLGRHLPIQMVWVGKEKPMGIAGRLQADLVLAAIPPQAPLPGLEQGRRRREVWSCFLWKQEWLLSWLTAGIQMSTSSFLPVPLCCSWQSSWLSPNSLLAMPAAFGSLDLHWISTLGINLNTASLLQTYAVL